MSRKEAVILVSRALAMIQLISALIESSYLPDRFVSLYHYTIRINGSAVSQPDNYLRSYYQLAIAFIFARIAILLFFAFIFWNCGPWIEQKLLPKNTEPDQQA
jgi:hypothetical protein